MFWSVTLPLARRGLAAGMVLAFARALGDFGATLMVAGNIPGLTQTAALAIYDAVQINDTHRAGWLTFWISLVSILALVRRAAHPPARGLISVSGRPPASPRSSRDPQDPRVAHLDVSLNLGCETGILFGPSGAGKTTLLRLISGLSRPEAGRVFLGGTTLFDSERSINRAAAQPPDRDDLSRRPAVSRTFPSPPMSVSVSRAGKQGRARDRLAEVAALCGVERLLGPHAGDALRRRAPAGRPGQGACAPSATLALRRARLGARSRQSPCA